MRPRARLCLAARGWQVLRAAPKLRQPVRARSAARPVDASTCGLGSRSFGLLRYKSSAVIVDFPVARAGALVDITNERSSRAATPSEVQRSRWQVNRSTW